MSLDSRIQIGPVKVSLSDIRGFFLEGTEYNVLLRNGYRIKATSEEVKQIRATLRKEVGVEIK